MAMQHFESLEREPAFAAPRRASDPRVRAWFVPALVAHLRTHGKEDDAARIARAYPPSDEGAVVLPVSHHLRLADDASVLLSDPFLGLNLGREAPDGLFGIFELGARFAADLSGACEWLARSLRAFGNAVTLDADVSEGGVSLVHALSGHPRVLGRHGNEFVCAILLRYVRRVTERDDVLPESVVFAHPRPKETDALEAFFGPNIAYGGSRNVLRFSRETAALPIPKYDRALSTWLDTRGPELVKPAPIVDEPVPGLRAALRSFVDDGTALTLAMAAKRLAMSGRTLQRVLGESETTFRAELDVVLTEKACEMLAEDRKVLEIAQRLGFSSASSFERAFRRWFGETPRAWRARAR